MSMFDKEYDKKGFDLKQIQSPILKLYQNAKQEINNKSDNIFSPSINSQNIQSSKKLYQHQLQPIQLIQRDDQKEFKNKPQPIQSSDRILSKDNSKGKIFQIQKDEMNGFDINNVNSNKLSAFQSYPQSPTQKDQFNCRLQSKQSEETPTQKSQKQNVIRFPNNEANLFQDGNQLQIQNDNNKIIKFESDQKSIQQLQSPRLRIKTIQKNMKSPTYQNLNKEKLSSNDLADFENLQNQIGEKLKTEQSKIENEGLFQIINEEEQISPIKNKINKNQHINANILEKGLPQTPSGEKFIQKQEISRPSSGRNQNFIIKMVNNHNYSDVNHIHNNNLNNANNGSNSVTRFQSKETSDTPKSQNREEKPLESQSEIKDRIDTQNSQQKGDSLQNLQEEKQINEQKQNKPNSNQNISSKIQSLNYINDGRELDSSPTEQNQNSKIKEKHDDKQAAIKEQSQNQRQESSMMLQTASEKKEINNLNNLKYIIESSNLNQNSNNNDYLDAQVGELIGQGAYGRVYKGFVKSSGKFIAIKEMKEEMMLGDDAHSLLESICKEIQLLKQLSHKNIVNYIGSKKQEGSVYIYMEYMPGGSISEMLKKYGGFDEEVIQKFVKQLLEGLIYLHSKGVIHRDLKGANILSDGQGNVKLADFGAARNIENILQYSLSQSEFCNSIKGSLYWMAPELIKNEKHGRRIDVWSLGCTVIEMASAQHPWENIKKFSDLANAVIEQQPIPIPQHLSEECKDFILKCCTYDKKMRPKSHQLFNHPFLQKKYS
ncbi:hypothetical protein ABPG72_010212 [Tetrahymena utriculariae]